MNRRLFCFILLVLASLSTAAQPMPSSTDVRKVCDLVNSYFMTTYSDYTANSFVRGKTRPSNIWTRGVYYEGLMAWYGCNPHEEYYDYAYNWAEFHKWNFRSSPATRNADDLCASQTYIDLYRLCPIEQHLRPTRAQMAMMLGNAKVDDWTWIDAIQMYMPSLAKMGALTGDERYFEKMWQMYSYSRNVIGGGLFNVNEGLWWRDADFVPPYKEPNGANCYWSRGNGWVIAALVRTIAEMPSSAVHRSQFVADFLSMAKAVVKCQRADGFWNVSLLCEDNYGGIELSGTALFVYSLAWGVNNGILDKATYEPVVLKAWNAMVSCCVRTDGSLAYVQGTGKQPSDGQPVTFDSRPDFEDYGTGCFLLAASEVYKMAIAAGR